MNRLATERSPYLLQHAHNPVDWYPWGEDAFAKARVEDRPIFLSIGYSTCHWCHVMEHESFEDPAIAEILNREFVPIKVDREERPDVDRVYMTFVQVTTGAGGWPMSVWLTPDLKPFFGGTYFPPTSRWGRPGFAEMLKEIARVWNEQRDKVRTSAETITEQLQVAGSSASGTTVPGAEVLVEAVAQFHHTFDWRRGGFGDAPKFPRPAELLFLLREHARTGHEVARQMALKTLHAMAVGGMRDHIGGGFHRYSVDADWRVPHFEKMLYDQAQLAIAYLDAAQSTGDPFYAQVAEDTLEYVRREMTDPEGGLYSAEDADSIPPGHPSAAAALRGPQRGSRVGGPALGTPPEHVGDPHPHKMEGAFYLWRAEEIGERLGPDANLFVLRFGIQRDGNAPHDPQGEFTGRNLLYIARSIEEVANMTGKDARTVTDALARARLALFEARRQRPRPHLDDKVLTAWNGLMIAAFARGARVLSSSVNLAAAQKAAAFIKNKMWDGTTRTVLRRYRAGEGAIEGYAEDYAFLIWGLLELFQADPDPAWLDWALTLQRRQDELFWDDAAGGWFSTTGRDSSVLLRLKEDHDGAEPSVSSVSVANLLILSHLMADPVFADRIDRALRNVAPKLPQFARALPMMLTGLSMYHAGMGQIAIVGPSDRDDTHHLLHAVNERYQPFSVVVGVCPGPAQTMLARVLPWVAPLTMRDGKATAYLCQDFVCKEPTTSAEGLVAQLADRGPRTKDQR